MSIILGILSLPYLNGTWDIISYAHSKVWGNRLLIDLDENFNKEKLVLLFKNDDAIINARECYPLRESGQFKTEVIIDTIYSNGQQLRDVPYSYGKQLIEVIYNHEPIGELYLWKTNNWHAHDYYIEVQDSLNFKILNGDIKGPDKRMMGGVQCYDKSYVSSRVERLLKCLKHDNLRIDKYQVEVKDEKTGKLKWVKYTGVRVTYVPTGQSASSHLSDDVQRNYWYALRELKEMKVYY
ncbi:MAG: hypothetical protein H6584_02585 [Flavobacteriales bacterium]|nr:hypothetical protein [Flavobacteriales bacterium]